MTKPTIEEAFGIAVKQTTNLIDGTKSLVPPPAASRVRARRYLPATADSVPGSRAQDTEAQIEAPPPPGA